jgi:hypothetical protein
MFLLIYLGRSAPCTLRTGKRKVPQEEGFQENRSVLPSLSAQRAMFFLIVPPGFFTHGPVNDGPDYNGFKNFNTIKIVGGIAIYNFFPDIVSE